MPRKSSPPPPAVERNGRAASASPKLPSLNTLRTEIDRIDRDLVALFNRRSEVSSEIGRVKARQGLEVWSPAREEEVLEKVQAASKGPMPAESLRVIFRELMSSSRALQLPLRIACLGPKYSYSHLAAVSKFGVAVEHVPVGSIAAVFEEVNRRHVQFGLVPLENSTDGRVADTLEMFTRHAGLKIRAEVRLRIHHCLLGRCEWGEVRQVYSKAQALSQCRHWLGKNLPQARVIPVTSTAAAAEMAQQQEFAAAVASRPAAEAYGLKVLAENIEDQPRNITRFAVIAEQGEARTGKDKTTLLIRMTNDPGSLVKVILPFEKAGLNLTMIESFPAADAAPASEQSYLFFLDCEGHAEDDALSKTLDVVRKRCERLDVLGSYPRSSFSEG